MTMIKDLITADVVEKIEKVVEVTPEENPTDASIIASMNIPFQPVADIVLIKPLEKVMVSKTLTVMDDEANEELFNKAKEEGRQPEDVILVTKEETKEVESIQQIGVVLALPERITSIKVGDKVVYNNRACAPFDLMHNDAVYVRFFDILGTWLK